VVDVVQKLGLVGGAKLGFKLGQELAGKWEGRLQGAVDVAKQQLRLQDSRDMHLETNGPSAVQHLADGRTEVGELQFTDGNMNKLQSERNGGWQGVRRQAGSVVRLVGGVVLLMLLRAAVAGWRFGAACVINVRRALHPQSVDRGGRASASSKELPAGEADALPQQRAALDEPVDWQQPRQFQDRQKWAR
jgi:hypothetical protein